MAKGLQSTTPIIHQFILQELTKGTRPGEINGMVAAKWSISIRKAGDHLSRVKTDLANKVGEQEKQAILGTLHERCEDNYRDAAILPAVPEVIDLKRKLISTHADLFGFGRAQQGTTINIDMRGLLPEPIQRAMTPIMYDEDMQ